MTKVIGFNGSEIERLTSWRTMLSLRGLIKLDQERKYDTLEYNKQTFDYILKEYISTSIQ